jgi:hypothetical protein
VLKVAGSLDGEVSERIEVDRRQRRVLARVFRARRLSQAGERC